MLEAHFEDSDTVLRVERDGVELCRVPLSSDQHECYAFRETRLWRGMLVLGLGHRVLFVEVTRVAHWHDLGEYFGHFFEAEDCLLVASCSRVHRFDGPGTPTWSSACLAVDGVIVESVADGLVLGSGEWDPPGDWRPFTLELTTGRHLQPLD